ncbi:MAG TPA: hypothetical protein VIX35_11200, partial [Vicinamibacterales bacterium]
NHVVVALVGETIKQTRCSTCDAEHVYKGARVPSRKKKNDSPDVETAVLASVNGTQLVARIERTDRGEHGDPAEAAGRPDSQDRQGRQETTPEPDPQKLAGATPDRAAGPNHQHEHDKERDEPRADQLPGGWVGHRTLIRATLPRTENDPPPPRPIPEFTMHQRQPRGGQGFRGGQGWGGRGGGGPRGNFSFGSGNGHSGPDRNGNVNGNSGGFGNGQGHRQGGGPQSPGNDQGRPPGQGGKRHRHGKHRRPR